MKSIFNTIAAGALLAVVSATPAHAQAAGDFVYDTAGAPVGTVISVENGIATIKTDKYEVPLPANSFTPYEGKLLFGMTQAALNAAVEADMAAAEASVSVGKEVKGVEGNAVGTIEVMDDETITIRLVSDKVVRIPADAIQRNAQGAIVLYKAADLEALGVEMTREQVAAQAEAEAAADADADMTAEAEVEADVATEAGTL
ncbi:hypothetical protein [Sphingomicrobium nitratireducens]|uniref:hypothetical protein n=1 Tax=Sphingomicrobium nitratireducens TaxID=2964666 RepID=UPI00223EBBA7|nr:hypothetical protein [Sphingomicrobium nitratireducens]